MAPLPPKAPSRSDLAFLKELLETGKVHPIINRRYIMEEISEALRYLEEGHARGKLVIAM
jgi:NADPH:quinone reductase-like Zn-dependent oxidoreductase